MVKEVSRERGSKSAFKLYHAVENDKNEFDIIFLEYEVCPESNELFGIVE